MRTLVTNVALLVAALSAVPVVAAAPQGSRDDALRWLEGVGRAPGVDRDGRSLVVVETASIGCPPGQKDWPSRRASAFDAAMNSCRDSAARFLSSEIRTALRVKSQLRQVVGIGEIGPAAQGMLGGADGSVASRDVDSVIEVVAQSALAGLSPWRTFESDDSVTVVAALSDKYAAAIAGNGDLGAAGQPMDAWFKGLDDGTILRTFGTLLRRDQSGMLAAVALGQARIPGPGMEDHAFDAAAEEATAGLSRLLGERAASSSLRTEMSRQIEAEGLPPQYRSVSEFSKLVTSASESADAGAGTQIGRRIVSVGPHRIAIVAKSLALGTGPGLDGASPTRVAPASGGCPPVPDNMAQAVRSITVDGIGVDRSTAISAALYEAIRQEGAVVKGNSRLEKRFREAVETSGEEVREKAAASTTQSTDVSTFANGFVFSYRLLSEEPEGAQVRVRLCANLVRFDPRNPRFGLTPTVAVLPFDVRAGKVRVAGAPADPVPLVGIAEGSLESALAGSRSFTVISEREEPRLRQVRQDIEAKVRSGRAGEIEALKLGQELTADFVLVGAVVQAEFDGPAGQRPQNIGPSNHASATVEARLLNVASNEVVWSQTATVMVKARDILKVRAGQGLQDPGEEALSPIALAVSRAARQLQESLAAAVPPPGAGAAVPAAKGVSIIRISGQTVTLDASDPRVRPGARFAVELLVDVRLPGNRVAVDRDRVAVIEVVSVSGQLAKAAVAEGDAGSIDPAKCEVVPLK